MPLSPADLAALAPAKTFGLVDRYLPEPYRRALSHTGDPMASLTRSTRGALRRALSELDAVQRSRALAFFEDLSDGRLLGALHDQSPWPEDTVESFRQRLIAFAALAMRGAATADRLLALAGLAMEASALPAPHPRVKEAEATKVAGRTRRVFSKVEGRVFVTADVLDAPLRRFETEIHPNIGAQSFEFVLDNPASETLPGLDGLAPMLWPDPVFTLTTGDAPFGPFALVQTDQAQVIVVNRILPPNSWLEFSPRDMGWRHDTGAPQRSTLGPFSLGSDKAALYAGYALSANDHRFPGATAHTPIGPLLSLRLAAGGAVAFTGAKAVQPPQWGALPQGQPIQMPSLLGEGRSRWRLLALSPESPATHELHAARFTPVPATAPITLSAQWFGRRPGEFALRLPLEALAPGMNGPLPHRRAWLDAAVERFKLAGTVRIAQEALFSEADTFASLVEVALHEKLQLRDAVRLTDPLAFADTAHPTDAANLTPVLNDSLQPRDSIAIEADTRLAAHETIRPTDRVEITSDVTLDFRDTIRPTDRVESTSEVSLTLRDTAHPVDAIATPRIPVIVVRPRVIPFSLAASVAHPTDKITLRSLRRPT